MLLGFAKDYNKNIVNFKHELTPLRSKNGKQVPKSILVTDKLSCPF